MNEQRVVIIDVRKIISFGKGTFVISMPRSWIAKNNLKKGDLLAVNDGGSELVLTSNQEPKQEVTELSIDSKEKNLDLLKAEIVSSYLNGYDTINILIEQSNHEVPKIKDILRNLSGMEIMEQTSSRIVAKNLINSSEITIATIIRRIDIITRAMIEDAILCHTGQCTYDSINPRDMDINRLYYLGYRVIKKAIKNPRIMKSLNTEPWHLHSDMLMIARLEKIADRQKRIARYLCNSHLERDTLEQLAKVHTDISETYNEVMKAYYNRDKTIALNIEVTTKDRTGECNQILERYTVQKGKTKGKETTSNHIAVAKIIENLKATATEIRNLARTVICYE